MKKIAARKQVSDLIDYCGKDRDDIFQPVRINISILGGNEIQLTLSDWHEDIASIVLVRTHEDSFHVGFSESYIKGFGPLLYDWAMEYATSEGYFLGCDIRTSVSLDAQKVWNYYLHNRPDIQAQPRFKWGTYKDFIYSLRKVSNFRSITSLLKSHNLFYLVDEYPNLFDMLRGGMLVPPNRGKDALRFDGVWEDYKRFIEDRDAHGFFDWVENQGMFYEFRKPNYTIKKQFLAGIKEGWFKNNSLPSITWFDE